MNDNFEEESRQLSRRKLSIKPVNVSDPCKAVVLYQPPNKSTHPGRNLTSAKVQPETIHETRLNDHSEKKKTRFGYKLPKWRILIFVTSIFLFGLTFLKCPATVLETCDQTSFNINLLNMEDELKKNIIGQTIAVNEIISSMELFQISVNRVVVHILFGGSGVGKTWTTSVMMKHLPKNVNVQKLFLSLSTHQDILGIYTKIQCCSWNFMFIEDADLINPRQLETLITVVDAVQQNKTCPQSKLAIIIPSNKGERELAKLLLDELNNNGTRLTLQPIRLQEILQQVKSPLLEMLRRYRIPFVPIPYLPMEKREVIACIEQDLRMKKKSATFEVVSNIFKNIKFYPPHLEYFAGSGCKSVSTYVNLYT